MISRAFTAVVLATAAFNLIACAKTQGNERLREKADIDAKSGQDAVDKRATDMEARLLRQQRFYQALNGKFEGKMKVDKNTYTVRFLITPTIALYEGDRVRSVDEITYDLTNLAFNIEEVTTAPISKNKVFSTGCVYSAIKAKTDEGFVLASSANCPVSYTLSLGYKAVNKDGKVRENSSPSVSRKVLDGDIEVMNKLSVEMRSVHRNGTLRFDVVRTN